MDSNKHQDVGINRFLLNIDFKRSDKKYIYYLYQESCSRNYYYINYPDYLPLKFSNNYIYKWYVPFFLTSTYKEIYYY